MINTVLVLCLLLVMQVVGLLINLQIIRLKQEGGLRDQTGDDVRIHVRCRSPVFKVPLPFDFCLVWNSDRRSTVCHPIAETTNISSLMFTSHSLIIVNAINSDMLLMLLLQFLDRFDYGAISTFLSHRQ